MDLQSLEISVSQLINQGIAPNTARVYNSAQSRFIKFCNNYNLSPLPLTENTICLFISYLFNQKLTHSTMKTYLSGIRHLSITAGLNDPHFHTMARLHYVLQGVRRSQSATSTHLKPRLPITPALLRCLQWVWLPPPGQASTPDSCMLWAAALLGFFGFLRSGEFTVPSHNTFNPQCHLTPSDITVDRYEDPSYCVSAYQTK